MNDRLREIFERNKGRQQKSYWKIRERLPFVISATAFLMSAFSLYMSTVLQTDDFRVIPSEPYADVVFEATSKSFLVRKLAPQFSFMNMGNRPVAVTDIGITVVQPRDRDLIDCYRYRADKPTFKLSTPPFTLKAGELLVSKLDLPDLPGSSDHVMRIPVEHDYLMSMGDRRGPLFEVCVFLNIITTERGVEKSSFSLFRHEFSRDEAFTHSTIFEPIVLIQRKGTIFDY